MNGVVWKISSPQFENSSLHCLNEILIPHQYSVNYPLGDLIFIRVSLLHESDIDISFELNCFIKGNNDLENGVIITTHEVLRKYDQCNAQIEFLSREKIPLFTLPISRTIVLSPRNQCASDELRKHHDMIVVFIKHHLRNEIVALTNDVIVKSPISNALLVFQISTIYDKYDRNNTQQRQLTSRITSYFRMATTTNVVFEREGENKQALDPIISRYFSFFVDQQPYRQTLVGYINTVFQNQSDDQFNLTTGVTSILLVGPSGSGKTQIIIQHLESLLPVQYISFIKLSLANLQPYKDSILVQTLNSAIVCQPCVILLDDLEYLAPHSDFVMDRESTNYANINSVSDCTKILPYSFRS